MGHRESTEPQTSPALGERQRLVLRAVVASYVGDGRPIGSPTLSHLLPVALSSASIRNTLAELAELGLIGKPHRSAGSMPTGTGLRVFVDQLLDRRGLDGFQRRELAGAVEETQAHALVETVTRLLSERTGQLGFVRVPGLRGLVVRHLSLVRLSSERVLVVLVSNTGVPHRLVVLDEGSGDQSELDSMATTLNERFAGCTLSEVRAALAREARALRDHADRIRRRTIELATRALEASEREAGDLVIGIRLAALDQPEFQDPDRLRQILAALERKERLVAVLDRVLAMPGVSVAFGDEVGEPTLRQLALVAAPCAGTDAGAIGVLGPSRMNYGRIIPMVDYLSRLVADKLNLNA